MKKLNLAIIGTGNRGNVYSEYTLKYPEEARICYACDINKERLRQFGNKYTVDQGHQFTDATEMLDKMEGVDAVIISVLDNDHYRYCIKALEKGCHVLLEKPMSPRAEECIEMGLLAEKYGRMLSVCHVLRYSPFFSKLKQLLDQEAIGRLISVQHNENVSYWHMAHSYVRGNFRKDSPMILAKSCHDMDILLWLVGRNCKKVSSFGSLSYFKSENALPGSAKRCLDGCTIENQCPFSARKIYLSEKTGWPTSMISVDMSYEARLKAIAEGPYGRCVFHSDNQVVDHQVVNLLFEDDITAAFTMNGFNKLGARTIKLVGTKGEIRGHMEKKEIEVRYFNSDRSDLFNTPDVYGSHGGGDTLLMKDFIHNIRSGDIHAGLTSAQISVQSHIMAFAAEESRLNGSIVDMKVFVDNISKGSLR